MPIEMSLTDEHEELRATLRAFLNECSDEATVREQMSTERGYDPDVWIQMAEQMGLAGLIIPEEFGGAGYGYVELLVVMEEMGRALLCSPYLSTAVFAANTLMHCADERNQKELLTEIAAGRMIATVAHAEPNGRWDIEGVEMTATRSGDQWTLSGAKSWVLDGGSAQVFLVVARTDSCLALFRVDPEAPGFRHETVPPLDLTRKLSQLHFEDTPAELISAGDQSANFERVLALTTAALSAEQMGGAQWCLETAVEYAKTRLQFGRPIGSYQAIKHKCADILVETEFARSAAYAACFAAAEQENDFLEMTDLAQSTCSEAFFHAAAETIQIHGGMGFTWELPVHLYFKRAKASDLLFGDATHHRERLANRVGL